MSLGGFVFFGCLAFLLGFGCGALRYSDCMIFIFDFYRRTPRGSRREAQLTARLLGVRPSRWPIEVDEQVHDWKKEGGR